MNSILTMQVWQFLILSLVLLGWALLYQARLRPWLLNTNKETGKPFPIFGVLGAFLVTVACVLAVTNDLANKKVPPPSGMSASEVQRVPIGSPEGEVSSASETLEEKAKRMTEENRQENQRAKEDFLKTPTGKPQ
jgi:hypothetical protein